MITWIVAVKLVVALFALGVSVHLARWRRQSRAEWKAYDAAHGMSELPATAASRRARNDRL